MVKIKKNKKYENTHGNGGDPANISNQLQSNSKQNNDKMLIVGKGLFIKYMIMHHMYANVKSLNTRNILSFTHYDHLHQMY